MPVEDSSSDASRDRLLRAAIEVFAERGFRDGTVREISGRAEVNIASVNYYFGSKEKLYAESLNLAFRQANALYPLQDAMDASLPAETRLAAFIKILLKKLLDESALGLHTRLIMREIVEPTNALDDVVKTAIAPQFQLVRELVLALLGPHSPDLAVQRVVLSILAQCLMYRHSRAVVDRLCPQVIASPEAIEQTAAHILRFSLAAIQGLTQLEETAL